MSNHPDKRGEQISYQQRQLSLTEKTISAVGDLIAPNRSIPLDQRLKKLTPQQKEQIQSIEDNAIANFVGNFDELEAALGMLRIGHHVGWKVLYLVHSKKTIRKYEEILNIKVREIFEETGPSSGRSIGLAFAEKFSNFWKVVSGEIKIDNRKDIF